MEKIVEFHENLNPDLWIDEENLNDEVLQKLLEASEEFYKFLNVQAPIEDIVILGSSANYTYTKYSDIDLHLIINFTRVDEDIKFAKEYFDAKKYVWNNEHDIKMFGMEVEFYVQDTREKNSSNAVYSIMNNKWVKKPEKENLKIDLKKIKSKAEGIKKSIEMSKDSLESLNKIKEKIKNMRQCGLEKYGEYSVENLTFKYLRNKKVIEKMLFYIRDNFDKKFSLDEVNEWNEILIK